MGRAPKQRATAITFEQDEMIPVDKLHLDMKNNRMTHLTLKDEQELEEQLWRTAKNIGPLKKDIKARGLQEPLVLWSESFTVVEGNCRLVCLKRLYHEAKAELKKNKSFESDPRLKEFLNFSVPCRRIAKDTPEVDINAYLTEIHVGRKEKWKEYNKARLLFTMKEDDDLTLEEISRISRSSRPTIAKKIDAYRHLHTYHKQFPDDAEFVNWFYYFWEFMHSSLDKFRRDETKVIKFMKWIHSGKFSNSKQVRILPKVLNNEEAFRKFEETDMAEAQRIIIKADPTITSPLYKKVSSLVNTLEVFPPREVRLLLKDPSRRYLLHSLVKAANKLLNEVESNEGDEE